METLRAIIPLVLKASILLTVLALGLKATAQDVGYLIARPGKLIRSLVAMDVVMPLFAMALVTVYPMHPAIKVALIALSVSPVPPVLPKRVIKAGGTEAYVLALMVVASVVAIVFVPAALFALGLVFGVRTRTDASVVASVVTTTVLAPLAVGIAINRYFPRFAEMVAKPLATISAILLAAGGIVVIAGFWPAMMSLIGEGVIVAMLAFVIVGLAAGHLLGGPEPESRSVLAFATAARHPGMAITIAAADFPQQKKLVAAAVVIYLLVSAIATIPYTVWRTRVHHRGAATTT